MSPCASSQCSEFRRVEDSRLHQNRRVALSELAAAIRANGPATRLIILRSKIAETIQKSTNILSWFSPPANHYLLGNSINYTQDVVSCAAGQYKTPSPKVKPRIPENPVARAVGDPNP
jgi:hypothetical protein